MELIDAKNLAIVTDVLALERQQLLDLLGGLDAADWERPTECPAYSVNGIAAHILGDDLSLLSRQRDGAVPGLMLIAEDMPGADFRALLDGFNDQWVKVARFLSPQVLLDLLRLSGEWSSTYYCEVDPTSPGEPVALFSTQAGAASPFWHAIAREYLERWTHHSQIRRALGLGSLAESPLLDVGVQIVATAAGVLPSARAGHADDWAIGPIVLGSREQTADILTLAYYVMLLTGRND